MTLVLDHASVAIATPRFARLIRAIRARFVAFHEYWFVVCVEPSDPFASLSSRDRWDLPVWHPAQPDGPEDTNQR